jgi:uncharacterized membrane protein
MSIPGRSLFAPLPHDPRNIHREVHEKMSRQDRIALALTGAVGTMYAVYLLAAIVLAWMLIESGQGATAIDPYPFAFLLFLGNIVQLLLMPLILVGQNIQSRHREAMADEEFQIVGKTFHDLDAVLAHLDLQDRELARLRTLVAGLVQAQVPEPDRTTLLRQASVAKPE